MRSDVAASYHAIGAKRKALDVAVATARDICDNGDYFESTGRASAYPHALGAGAWRIPKC